MIYYDEEGLIQFCCKHKITVEQFVFCYFTATKQFELIYKYCEEVRKFNGLIDLENRGLIKNEDKNGEMYPDSYLVNPKFAKELVNFISPYKEIDELWDACPDHVVSGGNRFIAKSIGIEELEKFYPKKLKRAAKNGFSHKDIVKALKEQAEAGTMGMGLKKWLDTEQWTREDNTLSCTSYDI